MAGAVVGFVYNHIGLGGVLLIDFATYVVSFLCYLAVRRGKHVVPRPAELRADIAAAETAEKRFWHELWEGIEFLRERPAVILLGLSWALFLGAMLTGVVVTPSLSDRIFHAGAVGYGWLNGGWGVGAFLSALYAPKVIARLGSRGAIALSMGFLAACMTLSPYTRLLALAVFFYGIMGSARGISGVAMNTSLMEQVPKHFMGRVQNAFYFVGTFLQIALSLTVGWMAQKVSLAGGFALIGSMYLIAFLSAVWPVGAPISPAIADAAQVPDRAPNRQSAPARGSQLASPPVILPIHPPHRRAPCPFTSKAATRWSSESPTSAPSPGPSRRACTPPACNWPSPTRTNASRKKPKTSSTPFPAPKATCAMFPRTKRLTAPSPS